MALSKAVQRIVDKALKKNTRSKGALSTGRVKAPESNLVEMEILEHPERYIENMPTLERPIDSYGGFYISESSREDFKRQSRNRWLEYATYKDINRLKYQVKQYELTQKRRGYRIDWKIPGIVQTKPARPSPEIPTLDLPVTPIATQHSGFPIPTGTTLEEPGFEVPSDLEEPKPKDPEKEFETCEDLEEKIHGITGMEIQICYRGDTRASILNLTSNAVKASGMVRRKNAKHRGRR